MTPSIAERTEGNPITPLSDSSKEGETTSSVASTDEPLLRSLESEVGTVRSSSDPLRVEKQPPQSALYPHLFDADQDAGQALAHVARALEDTRHALDAFDDIDLVEVSTRLGYVGTAMGQAFALSTFNEDFGIVVSYVRRAVLAADVQDLQLGALNALVKALRTLGESPTINLGEAVELVDELSDEGWNGEQKDADALLEALFSELSPGTSNSFQTDLFTPTLSQSNQ